MPKHHIVKIIKRNVTLGAIIAVLVITFSGAAGLTQAQPAPPSDPCVEYQALEEGRGHPHYQHWFNHLDAPGYARFRMACLDVYRWGGDQFACLDELWGRRESGWNHQAHNRSSGAYGIPQALPGSKMGNGWQYDPRVQVRWGLEYIRTGNSGTFWYRTPCQAVSFHNGRGYY